jgi:hypothetical protein
VIKFDNDLKYIGTLVSYTNQTEFRDITDLLLKVVWSIQ